MAGEDLAHARKASGTAQLFEQLARRVLERRHCGDLHASQWSALRYFERAGRQSATVIGLSRYLGNTSGSTSRTAKSLVDRGLLTVSRAAHDGRAVTFSLTETGRLMLAEDPLNEFASLLGRLPEEDLDTLSRSLDILAMQLEEMRGS